MVWGTFHFGGKSELVIIQGSVNQQVYQRVFGQDLLPWARSTFLYKFVLVQDTAPLNKARATVTFLEYQDVDGMDWPAKSPDMNLIENIWDQMSIHIRVIWITLLQHTNNRLVSQMRASLTACRELAGKLWQLCKVLYMFLNIKRNIFQSMLPLPTLWYFDISVICPHSFRRGNFVLIPLNLYSSNICEISLYDRQLLVIMYELIHVVRAAHR